MMRIVLHDSAVRCWAFVSSISHKALKWYGQLPSNLIDDWKTFKWLFLTEFSCTGDLPKEDTDLVNVKQEMGELNMEYFERFKKDHDLIDNEFDDFAVKCFRGGLAADSILKIEFSSKEPEDHNDMFRKAKRIATAEAPKSKIDKKTKGKESRDNTAKSKPAAEAKEKLEAFTP